ncbi:hypothetical protein [Parachitinimonas caeni]|uniref:Type IV pilus assembly protein PilX n=1 Tax=Parachitinimonas caeni TaxID=3031301 RepID=A0ABT7DXT8_9NEIS|nr:hypothetical protein [Parachitinimonas caeni]MDK2124873.1 hypothetical protein [Parachitinimonas caeni]
MRNKLTINQNGFVLFVVLVAMVVMMLVGIMALRATSFSSEISGNATLQKANVRAADAGIEIARQWLKLSSINKNLNSDILSGGGYYATWAAGAFKPSEYNWDSGNAYVLKSTDINDMSLRESDSGGERFRIRYVIHRMCKNSAPPTADHCMLPSESTGGWGSGASKGDRIDRAIGPFYRVTIRVDGPRNSTSYVQAVLQ